MTEGNVETSVRMDTTTDVNEPCPEPGEPHGRKAQQFTFWVGEV